MTYKLLLHAKVHKELKSLPHAIKERVIKIINQLASNPVPPSASKLQGRTGCYRIRVRDYRIVYEVHVTEIVIYVISVAHRKEVYRHFLQRKG